MFVSKEFEYRLQNEFMSLHCGHDCGCVSLKTIIKIWCTLHIQKHASTYAQFSFVCHSFSRVYWKRACFLHIFEIYFYICGWSYLSINCNVNVCASKHTVPNENHLRAKTVCAFWSTDLSHVTPHICVSLLLHIFHFIWWRWNPKHDDLDAHSPRKFPINK